MKSIPLHEFRIPDYPNSPIIINGTPLTIIDLGSSSPSSEQSEHDQNAISPTLAIPTILHNWSPDSLTAFLDLDAWFSLTWTRKNKSAKQTLEIGRVGNQITFGTLDSAGEEWDVMITYNVVLEGADRGKWVLNMKECMHGNRDVTDGDEASRLAAEMVTAWVRDRVWETGKRVMHEFYVEYAPMDVWGDGILMNPHWLYAPLSLTRCSMCGVSSSSSHAPPQEGSKEPSDSKPVNLQRCGKCGTATYCSPACQKRDWPVHKYICSLGLDERGQMLAITQKGGLIAWDRSRMYARERSGEVSKNPYLPEGTEKRWRAEEWFGEDTGAEGEEEEEEAQG